MNTEEHIAKLKKIMLPYIQDEEAYNNLSMNTDFIKDLKINSANLVDIVLDIEDEFDITIENDDIEKMTSVGTAIGLISVKISEK